MKQLVIAMAALVGMSSAALAAEPVALTDSQLDKVTAGQTTLSALLLPVALSQAGVAAGGVEVGPSGFAINLTAFTIALDKVTAGQTTLSALLLPVALSQAGVDVGGIAVGPSGFAINLTAFTTVLH